MAVNYIEMAAELANLGEHLAARSDGADPRMSWGRCRQLVSFGDQRAVRRVHGAVVG